MRQMTRNQTRERIITYIRSFLKEHDYAPTVRDILKGCDISSTAVVQYHLDVLQKEGRIQRDPEIFRSIRLMDNPSREKTLLNMVSVSLLGMIAAGEPIPVAWADAWQKHELDNIELPREITGNRQVFALKVKGQSMIDALIDDGDVVLMEPTHTAAPGEMVAVWIKDRREVTLKRLYFERDMVRLQPANQSMKPILQPADNVEIQGRVVGVIRKL
ncbi:MAG: transcriptional repressor LexA [Dehalococcoidales bacterium]|nr:transcriptional repressor LexA [Dehalococcoidales bacterium]